jgi:hypothetical protein
MMPSIVFGAKIRVSQRYPQKRPFAGRMSAQRHDHTRRNTTLRLFAGISVITGAENPTDCAIAATASRCRRPRFGLRSRRLRSNAWCSVPLRTLRVCKDHK